MGACDFTCRGFGKNARRAFNSAVQEAQHWHGHGGYTGTIAEKGECVEYAVPEDMSASDFVDLVKAVTWDSSGLLGVGLWSFYEEGDHAIGKLWNSLNDHQRISVIHAFKGTDDKWGPAGCVCLGHTAQCGDDDVSEYIFFGMASE